MKLLGSTKKDVDSDKNSENVPKLEESVEVVLVHCDLVKYDYQHTSKDLFSFVLNKQFGQLITISPHSLTMMNTVNTEFSFVEVWFTDQISQALEIEDNVNLTLNEIFNRTKISKICLRLLVFFHLQKNLVIEMVKN